MKDENMSRQAEEIRSSAIRLWRKIGGKEDERALRRLIYNRYCAESVSRERCTEWDARLHLMRKAIDDQVVGKSRPNNEFEFYWHCFELLVRERGPVDQELLHQFKALVSDYSDGHGRRRIWRRPPLNESGSQMLVCVLVSAAVLAVLLALLIYAILSHSHLSADIG